MGGVTGIILSGGKSRRFRSIRPDIRDKALYPIDDKPMILHIYESLIEVADRIIISIDDGSKIGEYSRYMDAEYVLDRYRYESPLNGVLSILDTIDRGYALILPNDTPYITGRTLRLLVGCLDEYDVSSPIMPNGRVETSIMALDIGRSKGFINMLRGFEYKRMAYIHRGLPRIKLVSPVKHNIPAREFTNINVPQVDASIQSYPDGPVRDDVELVREFSLGDVEDGRLDRLRGSLWYTIYTGDVYPEFLSYMVRGVYMFSAYTLLDSRDEYLKYIGRVILRALK